MYISPIISEDSACRETLGPAIENRGTTGYRSILGVQRELDFGPKMGNHWKCAYQKTQAPILTLSSDY